MYTRDIPVKLWGAFLRDFNRVHAGQRANVAVGLPLTGMMPAARGLPLLGATLERPGQSDGQLEVSVGSLVGGADGRGGHVTHVVPRPCRISLTEHGGEDYSLLIEAGDGTLTSLGLVQRPRAAWR